MANGQKPEPTDRELVAAMARGDADALKALSARYSRVLVALARRIVGNDADAEEIGADALWQAWRSAGTFDPARGSVSVWLVTLGRSRAIDRLRANKSREFRPEANDIAAETTDPRDDIDLAERAVVVRAALAQLESNEKTALEMAYYSDLSQSEIATKLGIPLGTVKTRIRSAMIKMRMALAHGRGN
ncbi:MAG TPA: sigma-70 family RNA polymerase sigma factor [Candidatus Binataceae bacterium]|nr:sigma-70 family RNA polymerase sigma factor [Candidatus Binataceae bacterium]